MNASHLVRQIVCSVDDSHTQRAGSTGLTHPVPVREHNVVNTLCDLYIVRIDKPATSHAEAPRTSCKVLEIDGIIAQELV